MTKKEVLNNKTKSIYLLEGELKNVEDLPRVSVIDKNIFNDHFNKYDFFKTDSPNKMGQYFLYEKLLEPTKLTHLPHDYILFYPKLGVYLNDLPCDQTIEIEWVNYRRTWEWNTKYDYEYNGKTYQSYIGQLPTEIESLPLWGDTILVYGVWDSMPNWKQLRQAYERTWWFHKTTEELRDIQLNRLFK